MREWIFWLSCAGILYTYLGYPALLWVWVHLSYQPVRKGPLQLPRVSLLIPAHNEEGVIRRKLENCLALDYPQESLEILVGTDGCTDSTDKIVAKFASNRLRHYRLPLRVGKPTVLNHLVWQSRRQILVFTDARQILAPDAIRQLVENFHDPNVGCVSGELILTHEEQSPVGEGVGLYWRYEKWIRQQESRIGSVIGATGALYAIRKSLYRPLAPDTVLDDVAIPMGIIRKGYRAIFEPCALATDQLSKNSSDEFRRKTRTLAGNYQLFVQQDSLLAPGSPIAWQFWSHKLFRTVVPFWLLLAFFTSATLSGPVYFWVWVAQLLFYGLAIVGGLAQYPALRHLGWRSARMAYVFCLLNLSALVGLYRFLRARQPVTWEKAYGT